LETIAAARAQLPGARVHVAGVVTAEAGLLGADGLLAVEDSSGGIFLRVLTTTEGLTVGRSVEVDGVLAAPYGQLEVRDLVTFTVGDEGADPTAARAELSDIGETTEGSLVSIRGTVDSVTTDGGRLTVTIGDGTSSVRALADPPTGLSKSDVAKGDVVLVTGIVSQRATATGRLDGYRLWLRRAKTCWYGPRYLPMPRILDPRLSQHRRRPPPSTGTWLRPSGLAAPPSTWKRP